MNDAETYNGWSNRETWVVNLWLTNEACTYDVLQHIVKAFDTLSEQASELEHWVRGEYETRRGEASMWSDLMSTALARVSWYEIVQNNQ